MKYSISFILVLSLFSSIISGQSKVKVNKKDFKIEEEGFESAWKHYKSGETLFSDGGFYFNLSLSEYEKAYLYNSENAELNYRMGVASLFSDRKDEAAGYFIKAFELNPDIAPDILFLTARALQFAGRYIDAAGKYTEFINQAGKKEKDLIPLAQRYQKECNVGFGLHASPLDIEITNLGEKINSPADDFSPVLTANGLALYFSSRRPVKRSSNFYPDNMPDENVYISSLNVAGDFSEAYLPKGDLNSEYCEVPLWIDPTGDKLYIYGGYVEAGDILVTGIKRDKWTEPADPGFGINSKSGESSFTMDKEGDIIYFVSNREKGSVGEKDIWSAERRSKKKWKRPVNLGEIINSEWNEESVSLSRGGDTLFFASDRQGSMGGYDLFASVKSSDGNWGSPQNLGSPLNTPFDDMFLIQHPSLDSLYYFSSDRRGGVGRLDLYSARILPPPSVIAEVIEEVAPPPVVTYDTIVVVKEAPMPVVAEKPAEFILAGKIVDSESNTPVFSRLDVIDLTTDRVVATSVTDTVSGEFRVRVPGKRSYLVDMRAPGFLSAMERVDIPPGFEGEEYFSLLSLIKVKVGRKVVLKNILFETGRAVLTVESFTELNRLVSIMSDNPTMRIEIAGHTDNTGSYAINMRLSKERAAAVVKYLEDNGVASGRLQFAGYGPDQPVVANDSAEGRSQNRRVEFKILEL